MFWKQTLEKPEGAIKDEQSTERRQTKHKQCRKQKRPATRTLAHVLAYCKQSLPLIRHTPRVMYIPQMIHVKHIIGQYLSDIGKLYIYLLLLLLGKYFSW